MTRLCGVLDLKSDLFTGELSFKGKCGRNWDSHIVKQFIDVSVSITVVTYIDFSGGICPDVSTLSYKTLVLLSSVNTTHTSLGIIEADIKGLVNNLK